MRVKLCGKASFVVGTLFFASVVAVSFAGSQKSPDSDQLEEINPLAAQVDHKLTHASGQRDLFEARQLAERGLSALQTVRKPPGLAWDEFQKFKSARSGLFNFAVGLSALQEKDWTTAQLYLHAAVEEIPTEFKYVYPLALAYLKATHPDYEKGTWFAARASVLAREPNQQQQIEKYARSQYVKYHGSDEGWPDLMARVKTNSEPAPADTDTEGASSNEVAPPNVEGGAAIELEEGQIPEQVEQLLGKPADRMTLKGSLIYIYPTVKVIFENRKLVDVQYQQKK